MPCFLAASAKGTSFLIAEAGIACAFVEILAILLYLFVPFSCLSRKDNDIFKRNSHMNLLSLCPT